MAKHFGLFGFKNPILGRGEIISEEVRRSPGGGGDNPIRTFEEAQQRLLPQLSNVVEHRSGFTSLDQSTARLRWTVSLVMPPI